MFSFKVDNLKNMNTELKSFAEFLRVSGASDDDVFACKLVACELITNVVRHGGDEAELKGNITGETIEITVSAESLKGVDMVRPAPDVFAESGRGLYIVKCFCGELKNDGGEVRAVIKRK